MKIDLELLQKARAIEAETGGVFCQDCGETEPPNGFYPMSIGSILKLSSWLCNDCEQARRTGA